MVCEQQRRRPACAYAQSDQRLCYSLIGKYHILTCYKRNFNILASLCSWGDWFESRFHGNPEDRFSRDEAQLIASKLPAISIKFVIDFHQRSISYSYYSTCKIDSGFGCKIRTTFEPVLPNKVNMTKKFQKPK